MNKKLFFALGVWLLAQSCDGGLTLPEVEPGIAGTITVVSPWPPEDSVKTLWLFASQIYPLDSATVVSGIIQGTIVVYPSLNQSLPYNVNVQSFRFPLQPATYLYIGVLQRFGSSFVDPKSYRVVGVLEDPGNPLLPRAVTVRPEEEITGLMIIVDFYDLPPQPF